MMKKMYLMKGMAVMAFGLVVASCNNTDLFNENAQQQAKEKEFSENFQNKIMGGKTIDSNQTWSTAKGMQVTVTPRQSGTLKIYMANPIGNRTASLYTTDATAGQAVSFTITKPSDLTQLYATILDENENILDFAAFNATASKAVVNMNLLNEDKAFTRADISNKPSHMPSAPTFTASSSKPAMPTKYSNTVPSNAKDVSTYQNYQNGDILFMRAQNGEIVYLNNPQNFSDLTIYADGNVTYTGGTNQNGNGTTFCVTSGSTLHLTSVSMALTVYLAPNATLDVSDNDVTFSCNNRGPAIFMSEGSKLISNKDKKLNIGNKYQVVNNGGTIVANNINMLNSAIIWNDATIKNENSKCDIFLLESNAELINNGTITVDSISLKAGSKMYNVGTTTVNGGTIINNSSDQWQNDGQYTSETFEITGGLHTKAYNNCKLTVTEEFIMGEGSFVLNGGDNYGASLIANSFTWVTNGYFYMGGKSLVKVENDLMSYKNNVDYGFFGVGNDYAVIQANAIKKNADNQYSMSYHGKLYVASNYHFEQGYLDDSHVQAYFEHDAEVKFGKTETDAPISIPVSENGCNPGYNYQKADTDPIQYYYYAFEDLGTTDDFDFNDVVIRVSAPDDNNLSTVELIAAGGTLPTIVTYNGEALGDEIHKLFEVDTKVMVNTTNGSKKDFIYLDPITVAPGTDMSSLAFGITVTGNNGQVTKVINSVQNHGKAPLVIVASGYPTGTNAGKWFWPTERTSISAAYTQFGAWGADASTNTNWYQNYESGNVYTW